MESLEQFGIRIPADKASDPGIQKDLAAIAAVLDANPLEGYNNTELLRAFGSDKIHKKQLAFHAIKPPPLGIKALIAANRAGKTIGCVVDDAIQLLPEDLVPAHLRPYKKWQPPFHVWVGAPKYSKHEDTIIPLFRKFLPRAAFAGGKFVYKSQSRLIELACGSTIGLKTYDQDLDAWASAEVHRIHWDEEPNTPNASDLRSEARARLISTGGEEIIGMTPLLGYSWVHDEVWERRNEDQISVVTMTMEDNPWNPPEVIREFAAGLTDEEKRMRLKGEFVHVGGLVYPQLSNDHFVEPPSQEHVRAQTVYVGIDPGVRTTAVVFVAFDADNHALVFDELFLHDRDAIPENAAEAIRAKLSNWGVDPRYFLIDPSARNRSLTDADRVQAAYARAGIRAWPAQNDVEAGIFEVKRRLEFQQILVSQDCNHLRWELERYRVDPKTDGRFAVIKQDDHGCFVAGTEVDTRRGAVPIEQVTQSYEVLTRSGYFPVEHLAQTQEQAEVYRLAFEGGELVGTGDHPVWVDGEFRRMDAVRYGDIITTWPRQSITTESGGGATPILQSSQTAAITAPRGTATYTDGSGQSTTAQSQPDAISTTSTGTTSTTIPRTWRASRQKNTPSNTGPPSGLKHQGGGLKWRRTLQSFGTLLPRAERGIENTDARHGQNVRRSTSAVINAEPNFSQLRAATRTAFAPTNASRRGGETAASTTRTEPVASADGPFASTSIPVLGTARVLAVEKLPARHAVFNLTVNGPSEYFANGVLVSNCDALRYVCMARPLAPTSSVRPATRRKQRWKQGTAPPMEPFKRPRDAGPMGLYS